MNLESQPLVLMSTWSSLSNSTLNGSYEKERLPIESSEEPLFLIFYYTLMCSIALMNIVGNTLIVVTVSRHENLQQPSNLLVVGLALSDTVMGFMFPLYNVSHDNRFSYILGTWRSCAPVLVMVIGAEMCSAYHLVAITATRFIAIMRPFRYHVYVNKTSMISLICSIWLVSYITAVSVYIMDKPDFKGYCQFEKIYLVREAFFFMTVTGIIPMTLMLILYGALVKVARKQLRQITACMPTISKQPSYRGHMLKREMKSTAVVTVLVGSFTIAWAPFMAYVIISTSCACVINKYFRAACRIILSLNYAINIFVYAGRLEEFRTHLRKDVMNCINCIQKPRFIN